MWNPVKELKGGQKLRVTPRRTNKWNPVKELKDNGGICNHSNLSHIVESGEGIERLHTHADT